MARTLIQNTSGLPVTLPLPYSTILPAGASVVVADDVATVSDALFTSVGMASVLTLSQVPAGNPLGPVPPVPSMGGQKLTNLGTPTSAGDAATKDYVDTHGGGGGTGTVTSVATGNGLTGGTITTTGTLKLDPPTADGQLFIGTAAGGGSWSKATLSVENGIAVTNAAGSVTIGSTANFIAAAGTGNPGPGSSASLAGGAGSGSGNGGDAVLIAGSGGAGAGGIGGDAYLLGGGGAGSNGSGGDAFVRGGEKIGSGTNGAVNIGDADTASIVVGAASIPTYINGPPAVAKEFQQTLSSTTPGTTDVVAASTTPVKIVSVGAGSPLTLDSTTPLAAGSADGQLFWLINSPDPMNGTFKIPNGGNVIADYTLGTLDFAPGTVAQFMWVAGFVKWLQIGKALTISF